MYDFSDYIILETLYESDKNIISKVQDKSGNLFTLKVLKEEHPSISTISHFKQEYDIVSQIDIINVRKVFSYKKIDNKHSILMEYFEGYSLRRLKEKKEIDVQKSLEIAIKLARALHEIHQHNIIHKDIKPDNILISGDLESIKIIDFGIASKINLKHQYLGNPDKLEGTLFYLSPEQTGRMNRLIDYRSDLYSLGVTLYELLTKQLPFENKISLELIHSHIARKPKRAYEINKDIPNILSDIIAKLLEKNAEDRYQSAFGLLVDLQSCYKGLYEGESINDLEFQLGKDDFSGKFQIPQKLYGREDEVSVLMRTFERVSGGAMELMLIAGYSGVGKSVLVYEVHKPITGKKGGFISGKFDQYQRDVPYYAFRQAFEQFVNQLLTESTNNLEIWKQKILLALEDKGQVLIDIIPSIEIIIGQQPEVPEVSPQEAMHRFNLVLKKFIEAISQKEHPLVIFIDDLQWADAASLNLLKVLMLDKKNQYLLIIGAYRNNEVHHSHPFITALKEIEKEKAIIHNIKLDNLSFEDVNILTSETLDCSTEFSLNLTKLVYDKTLGNAFFTNEFLKSLYQDQLLIFDFKSKKWKWDLEKISNKNITDNVVELMAAKICKLPEETQQVLKLASCIGNKFDPEILSIIYQKNIKQTFEDLWLALTEGLVVPLDNNYKQIGLLDEDTLHQIDRSEMFEHLSHKGKNKSEILLKFQHDRVQQASYLLINSAIKKETHLKIARLLFENTPTDLLNERIFDITNQYNQGAELVKDKNEILRLIELNFNAGLKAKQSAAHHSALNYYNQSCSLFIDNMWDEYRDLAWQIYKEKAWTEYSCAFCEESEKSVLKALENSINEDEKVKLYQIYLGTLFTLNRHEDGLQVGREALSMLGIKLPEKVGKQHIAFEFFKFKMRLGSRKADELYNLPEIKNKRALHISAIVYDLVPSSYMLNADLMGYVSMISANQCLKYGNSKFSSFSYGMAAIIYEGIVKNFKMAYELSMMAIKLNEKFPDLDAKARIHFLISNFTIHWAKPVKAHIPLMQTALQSALDAGSLNWANYAIAFCRTQNILFNNKNLEEIEKENLKYHEIHLNFKDPEVCNNQVFLLNFIQNLRNNYDNEIKDPFHFDKKEYQKEMLKKGNIMVRVYYYNFNLIEAFLFERFEVAFENAVKGFKIMFDSLGLIADFSFRFYFLLTVLSKNNSLNYWEKLKIKAQYKINRFLVKRHAQKCPENYLAYYFLVIAEESRIQQNDKKAIEYYQKAIDEAEKADFIQNTALCNELYAKYWLYNNNLKIASIYMTEAYYLYTLWGAISKCKQLEEKYDFLIKELDSYFKINTKIDLSNEISLKEPSFNPSISSASTSFDSSSIIDMHSLLKATQAISQEVHLKVLIKKMLEIVMENAGAEKSTLILNDKGKLKVEARSNINSNYYEDINSVPVEECDDLPLSIIHYVSRTKTSLVISDAQLNDNFNNDEYIKRVRPKSIFSFPIINKGKISCLIYLENNLTTNAFTEKRLELLQMLSSQMAISFENAILYENLEHKVAERTIELNEKNQRITDSIIYAKNIQNAILPTKDELKTYFNDHFILFKPKDIVSGDFYWFSKTKKALFLAVVDCTGHGVPGAFMSLIGDTLLKQIINKNNESDLAIILDQLHNAIKKALKQDETDNTDGMDICICKINYSNNENINITFVGAKRPLFYIKDNVLYELKGDRRSIGGLQRKIPFNNQMLELKKNDILILTSDGYCDTPNPDRKSLGAKKLRELFKYNCHKPLKDQKNILLQYLRDYQDGEGQRDDITIVGVKL